MPEPFSFVLMAIVAAAGIGPIYLERRLKRDASREWARAAEQLGFHMEGSPPCIRGRVGGLPLCVESYKPAEGNLQARLVITGEGWIDSDLVICAESSWAGIKKLLGDKDVKLQSATFDDRVHLKGKESRVLALLNHATRKAILRLLQYKGVVREGSIVVQMGGVSWRSRELVDLVHMAMELAERLVVPSGATARALAENAFSDPLPEVRKRNADCLSTLLCSPSRNEIDAAISGAFPLQEETRRAARTALSDRDPSLRLLGAMLAETDEVFPVLKALVLDAAVEAALRVRALRALTIRFHWTRSAPIVEMALATECQPLITEAVLAIAAAKEVRLLDRVCALADGAGADLGAAIVTTLVILEYGAAEPTLLRLLSNPADKVRLTAAAALEKVGTVRAVEPLLIIVEGRENRELKTAARAAVRAIQSRLGPVEAGRLSLVDNDEAVGALSLAEEKGKLSLS